MSSIFEVLTPAADASLLSVAELAACLGVPEDTNVDVLNELRASVSSDLAAECGIRTAPPAPVTFRQESLRDTFRLARGEPTLWLSRFPVLAISSITVDGTSLAPTDYLVTVASGALARIVDDRETRWRAAKVVVTYQAGWETVPESLKAAARKLAQRRWPDARPGAPNPNLKRERIEGWGEWERWVAPASDPAIPQDVRDMLVPYMHQVWA